MLTGSKRLKQAKGNDTQDRMSNLSDVVLTHILSFLKTKEAVSTSVLSTRWKSTWASVSTLDLSELDFSLKADGLTDITTKDVFLNFVDRVMMGHTHMLSLEKVAIESYDIDPCHIESWICAAVERNVRELNLVSTCYVGPPRELPQSLFSCNTLVVLKLCLNMVLNYPMSSTGLPNLKVLELQSIMYKDANSAQNLISSCPALEDLVIIRKQCDNLFSLNVMSHSLKNLLVQSKVDQPLQQKIMIDAPALESISIKDDVTEDYELSDLSSIIKAKFDVSNYLADFLELANYPTQIFKLLRGISGVKFLSLSRSAFSCLSDATSYNLPTFHNLTCLEFFDYERECQCSWKLILEFLKSSPLLEVLVIEDFTFSDDESWRWQWRNTVPECLHSHLKTIKILYFSECDLEKVSYLLENAKVLEKMIIELKDVREELLWLRKGSQRCQLEFL